MAKTPAKAAATAGYEVLAPVDHDGVRREPGSFLDVDAETAAPLIACGALKAPDAATPAE